MDDIYQCDFWHIFGDNGRLHHKKIRQLEKTCSNPAIKHYVHSLHPFRSLTRPISLSLDDSEGRSINRIRHRCGDHPITGDFVEINVDEIIVMEVMFS
jgi:hypothetical protein